MNIWCTGDLVYVGEAETAWRIDSFTERADGLTLAHLERADRADVHTTVFTTRLSEAS